MASAYDTEDGGAGFLNLGVEGVVGEVDGQVEELCPFGGVGTDVEGGACPVDLRDDDLDGQGGSLGGFVFLSKTEGVAFAESTRSALLFRGGCHESVDRYVAVLVLGRLWR